MIGGAFNCSGLRPEGLATGGADKWRSLYPEEFLTG